MAKKDVARRVAEEAAHPIIFLDIDGVLNDHAFNDVAQSCSLKPDNVAQLNRIVRETSARIVLSSAWRYMIHGKAMNLAGFSYMLRTHGLAEFVKIVGATAKDEDCPSCSFRHRKFQVSFNNSGLLICVKCGQPSTRSMQIRRWLKDSRAEDACYVVIDDMPFDFAKVGHPFVQTNSQTGLTDKDAAKVIRLLKKAEKAKEVKRGQHE